MVRAFKIFSAIVAALIILCVAALLYVEHGNLNMWLEDIEQRAALATGFEVDIQGELDVSIGNPLAASIGLIEISNPERPSTLPLATIDRLTVSIDPWTLLRGPLVIHAVDLSGAAVDLRADESGSANWQAERPQSESSDADEAPIVHLVTISASRAGYNGNYVNISGDVVLSDNSKPSLTAKIDAAQLDFSGDDDPEATTSDRLFADAELDFSWFSLLDVDAALAVDSLLISGEELTAVAAQVNLVDETLTIDPMSFTVGGGDVSAMLRLDEAEGQVDVQSSLTASQIRLAALATDNQDRDSVPPFDLELQLAGHGRSMHEIAASSNGRISGGHGQGQINMQGSGLLFSDLLTSVLRAINPLDEAEEFATLECSSINITINDGLATIDELAAQMERLIIIGDGEIDLDSETLDLVMHTKTREGLGLSLGGVVNSMLAIGGTLTNPSPKLDAAGSVTTAGAAVATGGLSVLAKGLWDRLSAEVDICSTD